jgi:hypothetical protein
MNKYQNKISLEIKQMKKYYNISYHKAKRWACDKMKFQIYTPCEDCDNMYCKNGKDKLFFCKDNR